MINKEQRLKLLNYYEKKEEKMFVGSIIDKINKYESANHIVHTNFLDLNQNNIVISILNKLNIKYYLLSPIDDLSRFVIFLIPEYMIEEKNVEDIISSYISVVKVVPKTKGKITHRDYMGTIYSVGLKEDMIGDIFVNNAVCYFFTFKSNEEYFLNNLTKVARSDISTVVLDVYSDEVKAIRQSFKSIDITVPSLRVDAVLSEVYSISRNETKTKINNGDLFVNSKEMFFVAYEVKENDILSFRKCGKLKVGQIIRITKSGKIVLNIQKYN